MEHTNSFLRKTYNQALSIFKFNSQDETVTSEPGPTMTSTANAPGSSSEQALNAYLTYVSLPLNAIMQGYFAFITVFSCLLHNINEFNIYF